MARGRKTARSDPRKAVAGVAVAALVLLGAALLALRDDEGPIGGAVGTYTPVSGFVDIHGLAVDPEASETLYAATHRGLFMGNASGWYRVGDVEDDYMGFTVHPRDGDTFWVSGHPRGGGNMGVRVSTDGGFTWRQTSLEGVDFHAMTVAPADPTDLWGAYRGRLYRSADAGESWDVLHERIPQVASLAAGPGDALYVGGPAGVAKSDDGGRTFTTIRGGAANVVGVSPHDARVLYVGDGGALHKSTDGGLTWTRLDADLAGGTPGHIAFDWRHAQTLYVATYETAIFRSVDGGTTWTTVKGPR